MAVDSGRRADHDARRTAGRRAQPLGFLGQREMPAVNPDLLPGCGIPILPGKLGHAVGQRDSARSDASSKAGASGAGVEFAAEQPVLIKRYDASGGARQACLASGAGAPATPARGLPPALCLPGRRVERTLCAKRCRTCSRLYAYCQRTCRPGVGCQKHDFSSGRVQPATLQRKCGLRSECSLPPISEFKITTAATLLRKSDRGRVCWSGNRRPTLLNTIAENDPLLGHL